MKRKLVISQLNRILGMLHSRRYTTHALQYSYFEWLVLGLMYEEKFEAQFKLADKELLKHFDIPKCNFVWEVDEYFKEIYNVYHPIRNNIETMDSIQEVRDCMNS